MSENTNDIQQEGFATGSAGDNVPSINSGQELQNLLFNPNAMNQLQSLATIMSRSVVTVPQHLRQNAGDCMAICMQAAQWGMNPFAVAQKTHLTQGGQLGYEAQLVNAVVANRAPVKNRLNYHFFGNWDQIIGKVQERASANGKGKYYVAAWNLSDEEGLGVEVSATLVGEDEPRTLRLLLRQCYPRFSTQWATDPQQQITYAATKKWARRYCPDVILGVYTPDELEAFAGDEREVGPASQPAAASRPSGYITDEQANELLRLAKIAGVDEQYVCEKAHVNNLHEIKAVRYEAAKGHLTKLSEMNAAGAEVVNDEQEAAHG